MGSDDTFNTAIEGLKGGAGGVEGSIAAILSWLEAPERASAEWARRRQVAHAKGLQGALRPLIEGGSGPAMGCLGSALYAMRPLVVKVAGEMGPTLQAAVASALTGAESSSTEGAMRLLASLAQSPDTCKQLVQAGALTWVSAGARSRSRVQLEALRAATILAKVEGDAAKEALFAAGCYDGALTALASGEEEVMTAACLCMDTLGLSSAVHRQLQPRSQEVVEALRPMFSPPVGGEGRLWAIGVLEGLARSDQGRVAVLGCQGGLTTGFLATGLSPNF